MSCEAAPTLRRQPPSRPTCAVKTDTALHSPSSIYVTTSYRALNRMYRSAIFHEVQRASAIFPAGGLVNTRAQTRAHGRNGAPLALGVPALQIKCSIVSSPMQWHSARILRKGNCSWQPTALAGLTWCDQRELGQIAQQCGHTMDLLKICCDVVDAGADLSWALAQAIYQFTCLRRPITKCAPDRER